MSARKALIVATGHYQHEDLLDLRSPVLDAEVITRVLGDPEVGGFDTIEPLIDTDRQTTMDRILGFFEDVNTDDFLFVYFSCHGRRGRNGRLNLAARDTDPNKLATTAIPGDFLAEQFDYCRAAQVIMVLDCCHAGAYAAEPVRRGNRDRIVILTANADQLAHEGDHEYFPGRPSAFCGAFFDGIESGRADTDQNGMITVREAFDHTVARLRLDKVKQSPQMRAGIAGDIVLCRTPKIAGSVPPELRVLLRHGLPAARQVAVHELSGWLASPDRDRVTAAERALDELRRDPDELIAKMAAALMASRGPQDEQSHVVDRPADPYWYRGAVCYEIQVRTFMDSNGDGIGDLPGLASKLEYLSWLGVDCVILSSIFTSPWDDDGNDVSDFRSVHPALGTTADLLELLEAAHQLGIRVVLDLVLNHTSTAHAWFEQSRRHADGPFGDYYVWRDASDLTLEPSDVLDGGWTHDLVRRQYFWHRFKPSEPDLNFDSPAVRDEMIAIALHWLSLGVDGFRLIGAPFLFEREEEGGEGLDETHEYLSRLRAAIEADFPGRALVAWANRWPTDAVEYFGNDERGPECNVVLYASLVPQIFLALRNQSHAAVSDVLAAASTLPPNTQWGLFLRNGDEMSLDAVDADERQVLLDRYGPLPRMNTPMGIRRRLAPMLDGDRRRMELCMALLLSLPGSPTIYYGDEIGMGENLALPGRSAMRAPMQWSSDRGGGYSTAEQDEFTLPALLNSSYGYLAVNVSAQRPNSTSLLNLVRQLIGIRRQSTALSVGEYRSIRSRNRAVMAYLRSGGDGDRKLCVANFSGYPQATALDLAEFDGSQVIEVSGRARFGLLGTDPFPIALPSYGYFWFSLVDERPVS